MASTENQESICVPVNNVPDDVMVDKIFPRLPAKSLSRFKCVSKLWLQAISDPKLAKSHLMFQTPGCINISPQSGAILHFTNSADQTQSYKLSLSDILGRGEDHLIPIKSCNGLLLVRQHRTVKHWIINPVTRRHISIPLAVNTVTRSVRLFRDCFMHYNNVSNEYLVLGWEANLFQNPIPIYVLVLGNCNLQSEISWKAFTHPQNLMMTRYKPALYNGWYHWTVIQRKVKDEWAVLALNNEIGEFRVMKVPDTPGMIPSIGWNYSLVVSKESLYLIQHHWPDMNNYCYVLWNLEDYEHQIWNEVSHYRLEYCQQCKESGWDSSTSASTTTTLFDVNEIIKRGPRYYRDVVHTNSLVWLDT